MFDNLRGFIDKIKPNFVKGGKFGWLQSTFEAFETFAFTPNTVTARGSHVRDAVDMKRAMITVVIALVPALLSVCGISVTRHRSTPKPGRLNLALPPVGGIACGLASCVCCRLLW